MSRFATDFWPGRWVAAWAVAIAALAAPARGAAPRDDLLRLVSDDVGFCVVVSDLRGHTEKILATPWVKALARSPLPRLLARSPEVKKLRALEERVQKRLKVSLLRLRDDILGDAVVFAYWPGPPEQPEQEKGLFLLWARDARLLAKTIELLNRDLKGLQTRRHRDVKYFRRVEARGRSNYYYLNGPLVAFSSREDAVRQVIDRALEGKGGGRASAAASVGEQLNRLGAGRALLALWFNPRAFEAHVREGISAVGGGPAAAACKTFLQYWRALEGAALAVSLGKDFEVKLALRAKTELLPAAARRFFDRASKSSDLWSRFPPTALLAVAGRIDFVAFTESLGEFLPAEARQSFLAGLNRGFDAGFGLDVSRDVLPYLGPDWGFCVTNSADSRTLVPLLTWALRVQPGPKKPPVDQALLNGLNSFALFAVFTYNSNTRIGSLKLRSIMQGNVEVKYLENDQFPAGFRPAYAVKDGYLLLTTSPEAIQGFGKAAASSTNSEDVPLLRVSLRAWGTFLKTRQEALVVYLAAKDQIPRAAAAGQIRSLLWVLGLFDRLELSQRTGSGQVTWTFTVHTADQAEK
jgi:hypothetical protein